MLCCVYFYIYNTRSLYIADPRYFCVYFKKIHKYSLKPIACLIYIPVNQFQQTFEGCILFEWFEIVTILFDWKVNISGN